MQATKPLMDSREINQCVDAFTENTDIFAE